MDLKDKSRTRKKYNPFKKETHHFDICRHKAINIQIMKLTQKRKK